MNVSVFGILIEVVGAFVVWAIKGFNGPFNNEMTGPHDSSLKSIRNAFISFVIIFICYTIVSKDDVSSKEIDLPAIEVKLNR